jgi:Flp pilus assembly protein TadD
MNRGIALHNLGRRDESNAVWRSMLPRVADDVRLTGVCLFHLGVAAGDAGRSDEALALFDDALARTAGATDRPDVQEVRGRIYCGKGFALAQRSRMEEANQAWLLGFEASPAEYDNAVSLAHSYHNMKRMDEARRWYLVATELFPAPEVMSNFAMCLAQMRLIDEIKPLLAKALAANPDPHAQASLQYRFGRAYDACGAFPLAIEAYTRATECPTRPETDNTRMPAEVTGDARSENINVGTPTLVRDHAAESRGGARNERRRQAGGADRPGRVARAPHHARLPAEQIDAVRRNGPQGGRAGGAGGGVCARPGGREEDARQILQGRVGGEGGQGAGGKRGNSQRAGSM